MNVVQEDGVASRVALPGTDPMPADAIVSIVGPENESGELAYLPRAIRIARDASNRPLLNLCLILARTPRGDELDIANLIDRGVLNLTATLRVPEALLTKVFGSAVPRAAFARSARFFLTNTENKTIAEVSASGPGANGSLCVNLDAQTARLVISALAGERSGLFLNAAIVTSVKPQSVTVVVEAAWVDFYDKLLEVIVGEPTFGLDKVEQALNAMRRSGKLRVSVAGSEQLDEQTTLACLLTAARRTGGVILARVDSMSGSRFRLRERPDPSYQWLHRETVSRPQLSENSLVTSLEKALGMVFSADDWPRHVSIVSPEGTSGMLSPLPRRSRGVAERGERDERDGAVQAMALVGSNMINVESVAMTNRPGLRPKPVAAGLQQFLLPDTKLAILEQGRVLSLPVVERITDTVFRDRLNSAQVWFVPKLAVLEPVPAEPAGNSAFDFAFERTGITEQGEPALSGFVRLTLCQQQSEGTQRALATMERVQATAVSILDLALHLSIPYVDSVDNTVKRVALRGSLEIQNNTIVAVIPLANRWLRLAYGALSTAGFQGNERARIEYAFSYRCYRRVQPQNINSVFGSKDASLPVHWKTPVPVNSAWGMNAATGVLRSGGVSLRFGGDEAGDTSFSVVDRGEQPHFSARQAIAMARPITLDRPLASTVLRPLPIEIRPPIADTLPILPETSYAEQSVGVQGEVTVLLPCNVFGGFYRQRFPEGWRSIGCQDALKLGQISSRLYEEIPELAGSWMRVFRSLPQPGRFLVLPRTLRISRYPPGHQREFLPAALVYAVLDSANVSASRYRFVATLEPDIPPYALWDLRQRLTAYAPKNAIYLDFPTEVADAIELPAMPLASQLFPPRFTVAPPGIQISLECLLPDALLLRRAIESLGVLGQLSFAFSDGMQLMTNLELNLSQIVGPWNQGPISVTRLSAQVRLTNRIERPVDLVEARLFVSGVWVRSVNIGQRLVNGQSLDIACEDSAEAVPIYIVPNAPAPSLEESRVYIEDVSINVIFTCGINFEARGMAELEIYARLKDGSAEQRVILQAGMPRVGEAKFIVLLSSFVAGTAAVAEYRVVRMMNNNERLEKSWTDCRGAVVDLQWETIS